MMRMIALTVASGLLLACGGSDVAPSGPDAHTAIDARVGQDSSVLDARLGDARNDPEAGTSDASSDAAADAPRDGATTADEVSLYIKASNADLYDEFGYSVAIDGDTLVVGAWQERSRTGINGDESNNAAQGAGAAYVYVYVRDGDTWRKQAFLKASNAGAFEHFGSSVAISGDTIVIGALDEDSNATGINGNQLDFSARKSGAAYVFVRSGEVWTQQAYLKASNSEAGDYFGHAVAIDGGTVVVGAVYESSTATGVNGDQTSNGADHAGAAYVFVRNGDAWTQQAYLKASDTDALDLFGYAVAIHGDVAVVSALSEDSSAVGVNGDDSDDSRDDAGAAYVFVRVGNAWSQQAYLKAPVDERRGKQFGGSVTVGVDTVAVGASTADTYRPREPGMSQPLGGPFSGAVDVFVRTGGAWGHQAHLKAENAGTNDLFGASVSLSGDTLAIGDWRMARVERCAWSQRRRKRQRRLEFGRGVRVRPNWNYVVAAVLRQGKQRRRVRRLWHSDGDHRFHAGRGRTRRERCGTRRSTDLSRSE